MEKFKKCELCDKIFNYQCGDFSNHLKENHYLTREEYIINTLYSGIRPKCQCGFCINDAKFISRKNLFHKINPKHRDFKWLEERYIEKYGQPICKGCNEKPVSFHRGKPNTYCSLSCKPSNWNQEQVNKTVMDKYGVNNVMDIDFVKEKVKIASTNSWKYNKKQVIKKIKKTKLDKYGDENYINLEKMRETCLKNHGVDSYSKTDVFRKLASDNIIKTNENNSFLLIKQYKNTNLYYQGTYEYRFLEYCENIGIINLIKRSKSFKYLKEDIKFGIKHLPDFEFKNTYIIEIKSTYILNKQGGFDKINAKKRSVESNHYQYLLILDNNFDEFTRISD